MKSKKVFIIGILIVAFIFVLSGCGSDTGDLSEQPSAANETVAAEAETVQQAITEQITEVVDTKTSVEELIGSWVDISAADVFIDAESGNLFLAYLDNISEYTKK